MPHGGGKSADVDQSSGIRCKPQADVDEARTAATTLPEKTAEENPAVAEDTSIALGEQVVEDQSNTIKYLRMERKAWTRLPCPSQSSFVQALLG